MPLYEVAILERPTKKEQEDGKPDRLIVPPVAVIANDPQAAAIAAVLDGAREKLTGLDTTRLEVLVRPFAE